MSPNIQLAIGLLIGLGLIPVLSLLFRAMSVEVDDGEAVLTEALVASGQGGGRQVAHDTADVVERLL